MVAFVGKARPVLLSFEQKRKREQVVCQLEDFLHSFESNTKIRGLTQLVVRW